MLLEEPVNWSKRKHWFSGATGITGTTIAGLLVLRKNRPTGLLVLLKNWAETTGFTGVTEELE